MLVEISMVPTARLELAHPFGYQYLKLARLPFRQVGIFESCFS